ncbi:MAG: hypothetical protein KF831_12060 [Acidobacteria bacterium]|nr:hypothetical protein [Acidobacteriota bacterium]
MPGSGHSRPGQGRNVNYFNYFTEIEDAFIRRRGKHLLLSPIDWALIEGWQKMGVPLHVAIRGIETVFDNFEANPRPRAIKSLMFCREEVEARFQEWLASQAGRSVEAGSEEARPGFTIEAIREHIERAASALDNVKAEGLREACERAAARLRILAGEVTTDFETVDKALNDIEEFLDNAMLSDRDNVHLKKVEGEVKAQLSSYKKEMAKEAYENTFRLMLLKRLREEAGIPRLGLFYL